jgi:hypothetical protein
MKGPSDITAEVHNVGRTLSGSIEAEGAPGLGGNRDCTAINLVSSCTILAK